VKLQFNTIKLFWLIWW